MGVWMTAAGKLKIEPKPDINLIREYVRFSQNTNPYAAMDEVFPNTWYIDADLDLQSVAGKFAEPSVWFKYVKKFFIDRGYEIIGDPKIIGECDDCYEGFDFWDFCKKQYDNYLKWTEFVKTL